MTSSSSSILVELELIENEAGLAVVDVVVSVTFVIAPDFVERQSTSCAMGYHQSFQSEVTCDCVKTCYTMNSWHSSDSLFHFVLSLHWHLLVVVEQYMFMSKSRQYECPVQLMNGSKSRLSLLSQSLCLHIK